MEAGTSRNRDPFIHPMEKPRGDLSWEGEEQAGLCQTEVPQPGQAGEVALVMLACAKPGWHLGWWCWGFLQEEVQPELSLFFRTRLMPKLSFIGLAGQIKRFFAPRLCPVDSWIPETWGFALSVLSGTDPRENTAFDLRALEKASTFE